MKDILKTEEFVVPAGVTVALKARIINVEGPRGKLVKNVRHVNMDIQLVRRPAPAWSIWRGASS
jgi:large subunit ribosomal protein L9e